MSTRYAWVIYTFTIPFFIILILCFKTQYSTQAAYNWSNLSKPYAIFQSAWNQQGLAVRQGQINGRYAAVRRDLGLEGEPILALPSSASSSFKLTSTTRLPRIKRALELIFIDEIEPFAPFVPGFPFSDDAENVPLRLTEDASWDYSNSKKTILDEFAQSILRDEEEAAAATLAKTLRATMRAKSKANKQKKAKPGLKTISNIKVRFGLTMRE